MKFHGASHRANTILLTTLFGNIKIKKHFGSLNFLAYSGVRGYLNKRQSGGHSSTSLLVRIVYDEGSARPGTRIT